MQCGTENTWNQRIHTAATLGWLRANHWAEIIPSYEEKDCDIRRAVAAIAQLPFSTPPDSPFIRALGTPAAQNVSPQTGTLAQRALEEWERTLCENKAVAILEQMQAGRPALIKRWRRNAYCHRPWQATRGRRGISGRPYRVHSRNDQDSARKQKLPLIAQMIKPAGSSDPPSNSAACSSGSHEHPSAGTPVQFQ